MKKSAINRRATPLAREPHSPAASGDGFGGISNVGILRNLRMPSVGLVLVLVGMHLMYFTPLMIPSTPEAGAVAGTYRYHFLARLLVTAGAFLEARAGGFWLVKRHPAWAAFSFVALPIMLLLSILDGAGVAWILQQQSAFVWMLLVPAMALRPNSWAWLLITMAAHAGFGSAHALYEIFVLGIATRIELLNSNLYMFVGVRLYAGLALLMLLPAFRDNWLRAITILAYISMCIESFFAGRRFPLLLIPFELLLLYYCFYKSFYETVRIRKKPIGWLWPTLGALGLMALVAQLKSDSSSMPQVVSMVKDASDELMTRTDGGNISKTILGNERWAELRSGIRSMTWGNWLVGKGLASAWDDPDGLYDEYRYGIHNSFVNAFYWGGIPLFLFVMTPLIWVLKVLRRSRDPVAIGCAAYMLINYVAFPLLIVYTDSLSWLVFCFALGKCAWTEALLSAPTRRIPARGSVRNAKAVA